MAFPGTERQRDRRAGTEGPGQKGRDSRTGTERLESLNPSFNLLFCPSLRLSTLFSNSHRLNESFIPLATFDAQTS